MYLLILWLSFFCRSRTSAIESSSGSCFMRILSSASSFSNFKASSKEFESKLRISSIKSFDCRYFSHVFDCFMFCFEFFYYSFVFGFAKKQKCKVAVSICYAIALLWNSKKQKIVFEFCFNGKLPYSVVDGHLNYRQACLCSL